MSMDANSGQDGLFIFSKPQKGHKAGLKQAFAPWLSGFKAFAMRVLTFLKHFAKKQPTNEQWEASGRPPPSTGSRGRGAAVPSTLPLINIATFRSLIIAD
jgi:hypothetical protein